MGFIKTVTAGLLALPSLLLLLVTAPVVAILSIPSLYLLCFETSDAPKQPSSSSSSNDNNNSNNEKISDHAIISGGSSGIGLSIARDCVKRGFSNVTIVARNKSNLEKAVQELETLKRNSKTQTIISFKSVDVTNPTLLKAAADEICCCTPTTTTSSKNDSNNDNNDDDDDDDDDAATAAAASATKKYYLFCCAGTAMPSYFEHIPSSTFAHLASCNQLGTIYTVQAFLPHMTQGTIVFTSSVCGQLGVFGYTAYCPTKFAIRGFAEALHAELVDQPHLNVQVAFPPDTDTPGFAQEEKTKPPETRIISENAGLAKPDDVANRMVQEAIKRNPSFLVYFGFEGWMVASLTAGMSPVSTVADAMTQVSLNGLFRFVSLFFLNDWWTMIRKCSQDRLDKNQPKRRPGDTGEKLDGTEKTD